MKIAIILIFAITAIGIFLGYRVLRLLKRVKQLQADRNELIKERSKQSDRLRLKGIEIDKLKKELDKYSDVEIKVALNGHEKQMILNALNVSDFKGWVEMPKTKHFIRILYRNLKEKIKESIKE